MSSVNFSRQHEGERFSEFVRSLGAHIAAAVLVAAAATLVLDNNGLIGFLIFAAGIVAALYLLVRGSRDPIAQVVDFVRRPRGKPPAFVPAQALLSAALALIPTVAGANLFEKTGEGLEDVLNLVCFLGFISIVAFYSLIAVATAIAWLLQDTRR